MPAIILQTSAQIPEAGKNSIAKALSTICAAEIGKPEDYVISVVNDNNIILFGGETGKAAWVEIKSIGGLTPEVNNAISQSVCNLLSDKLDIDPARVYITFSDLAPHDWGWNGKTF